MNEQEDQFYVEPDIQQLQQLKPIVLPDSTHTKPKSRLTESPRLKMVEVEKQPQFYLYRPFKFERKSEEQSQQESTDFLQNKKENQFSQNYNREQCVYQRYDNSSFNTFNGITYYAGQFANKNIFASSKCNETHQISDIMEQFYEIGSSLFHKKDKNLIFDSSFEGGNLHSAYKVNVQSIKMSDHQYDLVMSNDTNSTGSNQWFYFSVSGMAAGKQYTFNIINFTKNDSLFNYGLTPAVFSLAENKNFMNQSQFKSNETLQIELLEKGWKRKGKEVSYKRGTVQRQNSSRMYYRLSFKLSTNYEQDKLWISHSFPYSLSKLIKFTEDRFNRHKQLVQKIQIGKSLSKRTIEGLVISYQINKKRDNRKAVVIIARQHPGECQGSFVCEGVIDRLLLRSKQSEFLLKNYVFYVIPMVNPDGVVFGHYRTNLAGKDLNRKWNVGQKDTNCPQITSIKSFLSQISKQREIRFMLDLHGHSKKLNSFFYGNPFPQSPQVVKIFPFICGKLHPGIQYMDCTFSTEEQKRKAARVYLNYMYKLIHIYTFQSSFYAYQKQGKKIQFTPKEYRELGAALVSGLYLQLEHEIKYQQSFEFSTKKYANNKQYLNSAFVKYLNQLRSSKFLLEVGSAQESGSDSKPQEGEINNQEIEYNKLSKINTPTLALEKDKQSITKSMKVSRKLSQIKDYPRPTRNLKLLQISKINSVLPDKDQFCLQPSRKKQPTEAYTKLKAIKAAAESQTELIQNDLVIQQMTEQQIIKANLSNSIAINKSAQPRSISLVKSYQTRNNVIFKLDFMNTTSRNDQLMYTNRRKPSKHAFSQTLVSFNKINQLKQLIGLPQLQKNDKTEHWPTSAQIKLQPPPNSVTLLKKQTEVYISNMMKKIFNNKQSEHNSQLSKRYMIDKNFNIKKKEIHRK